MNLHNLLFTISSGHFQAAGKVVDEVFDKCYADLEPIGRRSRSLLSSVSSYIFSQLMFSPCRYACSDLFFSGTLMTFKELRMRSFSLATVNPWLICVWS